MDRDGVTRIRVCLTLSHKAPSHLRTRSTLVPLVLPLAHAARVQNNRICLRSISHIYSKKQHHIASRAHRTWGGSGKGEAHTAKYRRNACAARQREPERVRTQVACHRDHVADILKTASIVHATCVPQCRHWAPPSRLQHCFTPSRSVDPWIAVQVSLNHNLLHASVRSGGLWSTTVSCYG